MEDSLTAPSQNYYQRCYAQISKAINRTISTCSSDSGIKQDSWVAYRSVFEPESIRILVVDDHEFMFESIQRLLKSYEYFQLNHVSTLQDMWLRLSEETYDIILLDIHLPDGIGLEAVPKIRQRIPSVKIIPLTVEKDPDYIATHSLIGVDGWLVKGSKFCKTLPIILHRMLHDIDGLLSQYLIVQTHMPEIEILFTATKRGIPLKRERYLKAIVTTLPLAPDVEARYRAADLLGISPTSLKDYHHDLDLPPFTTCQRALCSAVATAYIWKYPELSIDQVAERVSQYCGRSIDRIIHRIFDLTQCQIRRLNSLKQLVSHKPFRMSFVCMSDNKITDRSVRIRITIMEPE